MPILKIFPHKYCFDFLKNGHKQTTIPTEKKKKYKV